MITRLFGDKRAGSRKDRIGQDQSRFGRDNAGFAQDLAWKTKTAYGAAESVDLIHCCARRLRQYSHCRIARAAGHLPNNVV
jgi:hypothetical protein